MVAMRWRTSRGFTLVELMIAIALLAILATVALPFYQDIIAEQRNRAVTNDLHSALVLARSEAVKRNTQITLGPVGTWTAGWRIASPVAGQPDLLNHSLVPGITVTSAAAAITFGASGRANAAVEFELTSDTNVNAVRCLSLGVDGRASVEKGDC
ncbi:Fimbrial protein precursor [compost metagenome]